MNIRRVKAVARKETYHLLRDFRSLYLAFAIPLLLMLLFGYALSLDVNDVLTVVVDQSHTPLSRDFIARLDASAYFRVARHLSGTESVATELDRGRASLALVIPPDWTAQLRANRLAPLQVILDGSDPNFANVAQSYITAFVARYNQQLLAAFLNRQGAAPILPPVEGRIRIWFNEDLESRNFIIPGILAIIMVIAGAILTSLVIAREYENGTMETLKSLPLRAGELLLGKALPYFVIGMADMLIAVVVGQLLFGVVMKSSFWLMVLASALYLAVALALGLLISAAVKSQLVANQVAMLLTLLPSLLLSNFVFPVSNMPAVLQMLTVIVPATYFIDILGGIYLRNIGLAWLWPDFAVLATMAVLLLLLTLHLLRREGL